MVLHPLGEISLMLGWANGRVVGRIRGRPGGIVLGGPSLGALAGAGAAMSRSGSAAWQSLQFIVFPTFLFAGASWVLRLRIVRASKQILKRSGPSNGWT